MKVNKFMLTALLFGAVALVGCDPKKGNNPDPDPEPTPEPTLEIPAVDDPGAGKVTLVINIPEGTACYGIVFKGTNDNWSTIPEVPFTAVPDAENWYQVTLDLAETAMTGNDQGSYFYYGKACLLPEEGGVVDNNWTTQWKDGQLELLEYNGATGPAVIGIEGDESNKLGVLDAGVVYIKVSAWQSVPCKTDEKYTVNLKAPALPEGYSEVYIVGSVKESTWSEDVAMTLNGDVWTATVTGQSTDEIKFRLSKGAWTTQLEQLVVTEENPEGTWEALGNLGLGENLTLDVDYSDATKYRWTPAN